ncbi:hypothetical protein IFO70_34960 [Phormidium tenue FACHB-886]|nr:hypothetical protein [Phormidium tenue FACHB-886]
MSLHPRPIDPIPEATARITRQAFPKGNRYILRLCRKNILGTNDRYRLHSLKQQFQRLLQ